MRTRWLVRTLPVLLLAVEAASTELSAQRELVAIHGENGYQKPTTIRGLLRWTSDLLVGCDFCEPNPTLLSTDSQGHGESFPLRIPGADVVSVRDVASGPDRSLVAIGLTISGKRRSTFLARISPDRSEQTITRLDPFDPNVVTVAPDGTIWSVGSVMQDVAHRQYDNVLRHYTAGGEMLTSTLLGGLRPQSNGFPVVSNVSNLLSSKDRIGWLTNSCQYIEFSFDAVELGRYSCPNDSTRPGDFGGVALGASNDLLISSKCCGPLAPLELDRATGLWTPVPVSQDSGKTWMIWGFDGDALVAASMNSTMRRYAWSGQAAGGQ